MHLYPAATILDMILLYVLVFPIGYLLLNLRKSARKRHPFFVELPIYLSLGLVLLSLLSFIAGFVIVHPVVLVLPSVVAWAIFMYMIFRKQIPFSSDNFRSLNSIIPLTLFLLSSVYFAVVVSLAKWPPVGDIVNHGTIVSLVLYNKRMPLTYAPLGNYPINYPLGFHLLSANFSLLTNLYPGEAVFLLGAVIVALIPSVVYRLTYMYTGSKELSILSFVSCYLLNSSSNLEHWLTGFFFNGPYPCLFGFLSLLTLVSISGSLLLVIMISLQLLVTYPSFTSYSFLYTLLFFVKPALSSEDSKVHANRKTALFILGVASVLIVLTVIFSSPLAEFLNAHISYAFKETLPLQLPSLVKAFEDPSFTIPLIAALVISISFATKRAYVPLSFIYQLIFFSLIAYVFIRPLTPYLGLLGLPGRAMIINKLLSFTLISIWVCNILEKQRPMSIKTFNRISKIKWKKCIVYGASLATMLISAFLIPVYGRPNGMGWFLNDTASADDFRALEWINVNTNASDLIMNDPSWTGLYLLSLSLKNVTFYYIVEDFQRAIEIKEIWINPHNQTLTYLLLRKYQVKYLLLTSQQGFFDSEIWGGNNSFKHKPYTSVEYSNIFAKYTFLRPVFRFRDTVIYKVILT